MNQQNIKEVSRTHQKKNTQRTETPAETWGVLVDVLISFALSVECPTFYTNFFN
jgi:hypothetical protein